MSHNDLIIRAMCVATPSIVGVDRAVDPRHVIALVSALDGFDPNADRPVPDGVTIKPSMWDGRLFATLDAAERSIGGHSFGMIYEGNGWELTW